MCLSHRVAWAHSVEQHSYCSKNGFGPSLNFGWATHKHKSGPTMSERQAESAENRSGSVAAQAATLRACAWTLWDPLEMTAEVKGGLPVRKQTLFLPQPLPKRLRCCEWDHTRLASIYHFVGEKPTTQETIKHCKRPRYQTPQWLLDEEALPFSSKSHYA